MQNESRYTAISPHFICGARRLIIVIPTRSASRRVEVAAKKEWESARELLRCDEEQTRIAGRKRAT
jgi:hypothetical protein